jgi:ATP-dependent DNA helicase RecG
MPELIDDLLSTLRAAGGDTAAIEVKSAEGGLPESITASLSALANLPGGGYLILGLDERNGFHSVTLSDTQTLKQGLANKARSYAPPVRLTFHEARVDGLPVVLASVAECDPADKPCRVQGSGAAYGRSYDGDHALSDLEIQSFLRARTAPHEDRQSVPGSSVADLDVELLKAWREQLTSTNDRLAEFESQEQLERAGIVTSTGELSRAGLFAFGTYPQQYYPRFVVHVADRRGSGGPIRARDLQSISGSIPVMLTRSMEWLRRHVSNVVATAPDGSLHDVPEYPLEALREIVANALIHRDVSDWSEGQAVEVRLDDDRLVITNPGGLYGITIDRLGVEKVSSARNGRLLSLCVNARNPEDGSRVVEALSSGLRRVTELLAARSLPPALYQDYGISFTVVLRSTFTLHSQAEYHGTVTMTAGGTVARGTPLQRRLADQLHSRKRMTVQELATATGQKDNNVRQVLARMRKEGAVVMEGGPGRMTTYSLRDEG